MATSNIKQLVDSKIGDKKIMVFSKTYCQYCNKAKKALKQAILDENLDGLVECDIMEIENNPNCRAIQEYLGTITGAQSVPRVFINGKFIGGGDDITRMQSKKTLGPLIQTVKK